jgi:hypothetical protein
MAVLLAEVKDLADEAALVALVQLPAGVLDGVFDD